MFKLKTLIVLSILFSLTSVYAQNEQVNLDKTPKWAEQMYKNDGNVTLVDKMYRDYYKTNKYHKNTHTLYYKHWRRTLDKFINNQGYVDSNLILSFSQKMEKHKLLYRSNRSNRAAGNWTVLGPFEEKSFTGGQTRPSGAQANVTSIGISKSNPNIIYCGTEPGEIYKSINGGDNWINVSFSIVTGYNTQTVVANSRVRRIVVDFTNPNKVYAVSGNEIFISSNGGTSWTSHVFSSAPLVGYIVTPHELQIDPNNANKLLIAGLGGLYNSIDGGITWTQIFTQECFDVRFQPRNSSIVYALRRNNTTRIHEFVRSSDGGASWTIITSGWYNSTDANRNIIGGRLGVTPADSSLVYAYLTGDSKMGDNGCIGLYHSNDGGLNWINTMTYNGAPYSGTRPNLGSSNIPGFAFNQGMYNCAMTVSNTNANEVLIGGINLYKSTNGGVSFQSLVDYYIPGLHYMHVDMQDFRSEGNNYYVTTDGGIFKSIDFFTTQPDFKMKGIHGADYWGFGSGWNFDILTGGTFHNGVDVYTETYPSGQFYSAANGEPASGYVNPGDTNRIYWTDNSLQVPLSTSGRNSNYFTLGLAPNESPWFAESSKLLFHPNYYNHIYAGEDNQIFKSEDGGVNFNSIHTGPSNSEFLDMEISRQNTTVMYAVSINATRNVISLYKTIDEWQNFSKLPLPLGVQSRLLVELDPENENILWISYPRGPNGSKVFKSINGGLTWINITSPELNNQRIYAMTAIGGTDGGLYINTNVTCYYKNNTMSNWAIDNLGLPLSISARDIRPFYRDGKVRIASYGKGIWESSLYEKPSRPVATIMVDKLTVECANDLFYFDDYSMLNHKNATWEWTFENSSTPTSNKRNPVVSFNKNGEQLVTLKVTNSAGVYSKDSLSINITSNNAAMLKENFENSFPPTYWDLFNPYWVKNPTLGAYGKSASCMMIDNFNINQVGRKFNIDTKVDLGNAYTSNCKLSFDIAYAQPNATTSDSLEVLVSEDCGDTWTSVYFKSGNGLATTSTLSATFFTPSSSQWRTETIDFANYANKPNIFIRFSNTNNFGQALYIDNVNIESNQVPNNNPNNDINFYPNPITADRFLIIEDGTDGIISFAIYDINGKLIGSDKTQSGSRIDLLNWNLSSGAYHLSMKSDTKIRRAKLIVVGRK